MTNFAVRADRIHSCGMTLNALARKVHRCINEPQNAVDYDQLVTEYEEVLQRHENHSNIDYLFTKLQMTNYYKNSWWLPLHVRLVYGAQFLPYVALLLLEFSWVYLLVTPPAT